MYKAVIYFEAEVDDFEQGLTGEYGASWTEEFTTKTKEELRERISYTTNTKWEDIEQEDINDYPNASEYHTSYLTNEDNEGEASAEEVEEWKQGKLKLWAVNCHILVSKVTEAKALI